MVPPGVLVSDVWGGGGGGGGHIHFYYPNIIYKNEDVY